MAVVGGLERTRRFHREIIESLGGEMVAYLSGGQVSGITGLDSADYVLLLTKGQSHKTFMKVISETTKERLIYVNSLGKGAIREALLKKVSGGG